MNDLPFTHIYERARSKMQLTRDEYALVNYVHTWAGYPGNSRPGWCDRTLRQKAEFIGITERGVTKMQNRLIDVGLIEKDAITSHVRATRIWFEIIHEARAEESEKRAFQLNGEQSSAPGKEQSSAKTGNKVPRTREQSSVDEGNKVPPHNKGFLFNPIEEGKEDIIDFETETPSETVISYLNKLTGSSFSPKREDTVSSISARLKEGFTVDDLLLVVEFKFAEWFKNEEMNQYLRPITLFGKKKFEGYVQAAKRWEVSGKPNLSKNGKFPSNNGAGIVTDQNFKNSTSGAFN